jgi:putative endonuclease
MENHQDRRLILGRSGEDAAVEYLERLHFRILARGFRLLRGEIDIVARDGETIVFLEVKTRMSSDYGPPEEAVTAAKQRQIRRIAEGFLAKHRIGPDVPCRFDVLSLFIEGRSAPRIRHIRDAF